MEKIYQSRLYDDRDVLRASSRPLATNRTEDAAVVRACQQAIQRSEALLLRMPNTTISRPRAAKSDYSGDEILRLFYSSRIPASKYPQQIQDDTDNIIRVSHKENANFGITGVLVTDRRMYSQVIEGPVKSVKDLIGRISCDARHQGIRIISREAAWKRLFADWSMAFIVTDCDLEAQDQGFPTEDDKTASAVSSFCSSVGIATV